MKQYYVETYLTEEAKEQLLKIFTRLGWMPEPDEEGGYWITVPDEDKKMMLLLAECIE